MTGESGTDNTGQDGGNISPSPDQQSQHQDKGPNNSQDTSCQSQSPQAGGNETSGHVAHNRIGPPGSSPKEACKMDGRMSFHNIEFHGQSMMKITKEHNGDVEEMFTYRQMKARFLGHVPKEEIKKVFRQLGCKTLQLFLEKENVEALDKLCFETSEQTYTGEKLFSIRISDAEKLYKHFCASTQEKKVDTGGKVATEMKHCILESVENTGCTHKSRNDHWKPVCIPENKAVESNQGADMHTDTALQECFNPKEATVMAPHEKRNATESQSNSDYTMSTQVTPRDRTHRLHVDSPFVIIDSSVQSHRTGVQTGCIDYSGRSVLSFLTRNDIRYFLKKEVYTKVVRSLMGKLHSAHSFTHICQKLGIKEKECTMEEVRLGNQVSNMTVTTKTKLIAEKDLLKIHNHYHKSRSKSKSPKRNGATDVDQNDDRYQDRLFKVPACPVSPVKSKVTSLSPATNRISVTRPQKDKVASLWKGTKKHVIRPLLLGNSQQGKKPQHACQQVSRIPEQETSKESVDTRSLQSFSKKVFGDQKHNLKVGAHKNFTESQKTAVKNRPKCKSSSHATTNCWRSKPSDAAAVASKKIQGGITTLGGVQMPFVIIHGSNYVLRSQLRKSVVDPMYKVSSKEFVTVCDEDLKIRCKTCHEDRKQYILSIFPSLKPESIVAGNSRLITSDDATKIVNHFKKLLCGINVIDWMGHEMVCINRRTRMYYLGFQIRQVVAKRTVELGARVGLLQFSRLCQRLVTCHTITPEEWEACCAVAPNLDKEIVNQSNLVLVSSNDVGKFGHFYTSLDEEKRGGSRNRTKMKTTFTCQICSRKFSATLLLNHHHGHRSPSGNRPIHSSVHCSEKDDVDNSKTSVSSQPDAETTNIRPTVDTCCTPGSNGFRSSEENMAEVGGDSSEMSVSSSNCARDESHLDVPNNREGGTENCPAVKGDISDSIISSELVMSSSSSSQHTTDNILSGNETGNKSDSTNHSEENQVCVLPSGRDVSSLENVEDFIWIPDDDDDDDEVPGNALSNNQSSEQPNSGQEQGGAQNIASTEEQPEKWRRGVFDLLQSQHSAPQKGTECIIDIVPKEEKSVASNECDSPDSRKSQRDPNSPARSVKRKSQEDELGPEKKRVAMENSVATVLGNCENGSSSEGSVHREPAFAQFHRLNTLLETSQRPQQKRRASSPVCSPAKAVVRRKVSAPDSVDDTTHAVKECGMPPEAERPLTSETLDSNQSQSYESGDSRINEGEESLDSERDEHDRREISMEIDEAGTHPTLEITSTESPENLHVACALSGVPVEQTEEGMDDSPAVDHPVPFSSYKPSIAESISAKRELCVSRSQDGATHQQWSGDHSVTSEKSSKNPAFFSGGVISPERSKIVQNIIHSSKYSKKSEAEQDEYFDGRNLKEPSRTAHHQVESPEADTNSDTDTCPYEDGSPEKYPETSGELLQRQDSERETETNLLISRNDLKECLNISGDSAQSPVTTSCSIYEQTAISELHTNNAQVTPKDEYRASCLHAQSLDKFSHASEEIRERFGRNPCSECPYKSQAPSNTPVQMQESQTEAESGPSGVCHEQAVVREPYKNHSMSSPPSDQVALKAEYRALCLHASRQKRVSNASEKMQDSVGVSDKGPVNRHQETSTVPLPPAQGSPTAEQWRSSKDQSPDSDRTWRIKETATSRYQGPSDRISLTLQRTGDKTSHSSGQSDDQRKYNESSLQKLQSIVDNTQNNVSTKSLQTKHTYMTNASEVLRNERLAENMQVAGGSLYDTLPHIGKHAQLNGNRSEASAAVPMSSGQCMMEGSVAVGTASVDTVNQVPNVQPAKVSQRNHAIGGDSRPQRHTDPQNALSHQRIYDSITTIYRAANVQQQLQNQRNVTNQELSAKSGYQIQQSADAVSHGQSFTAHWPSLMSSNHTPRHPGAQSQQLMPPPQPPYMNAVPQRRTSPHQMLPQQAAFSHQAAVAPQASMPPRQRLGPPHQASIPPHQGFCPPHQASVAPHQGFGPPHQASIPHYESVSPQQATVPLHHLPAGPHHAMGPPHTAVSPRQVAAPHQHARVSPHQGAMSPGQMGASGPKAAVGGQPSQMSPVSTGTDQGGHFDKKEVNSKIIQGQNLLTDAINQLVHQVKKLEGMNQILTEKLSSAKSEEQKRMEEESRRYSRLQQQMTQMTKENLKLKLELQNSEKKALSAIQSLQNVMGRNAELEGQVRALQGQGYYIQR